MNTIVTYVVTNYICVAGSKAIGYTHKSFYIV